MSTEAAVEARGLAFAYGERRALDGLDFTVAGGGMHAFLGPNGSGKSTLFKLLATILPLRAGELSVLGCDLRRDAAALRRRLGVVFQSPAVDRKLSVRQNLWYGGRIAGIDRAELAVRIDEMLALTGLAGRSADRVETLSGGLRRRVEIAKALLVRPRLLLLDEPSTGLDPNARGDLWQLLRGLDGVTVLFTTHLLDEADLADSVLILDRGRLVAQGSPAALKAGVGGELLLIDASDVDAAARVLRERLGIDAAPVRGRLRAQLDGAHRRVTDVVEALGPLHRAVTVSPPSLEDVFFAATGAGFDGDQPAGA